MLKSFSDTEKRVLFFGLLIKIIFGMFYASPLTKDLFIPFVNYFVEHPDTSPYAHFLGMGQSVAFPYPALMLFILAIPKFLFGWISSSTTFDLFLFHIPILISDVVIYLIIRSWITFRKERLLWFYWLSPVLIYINYIYGQLDAIPIAGLFICMHFLFRERLITSAIFMGLALATKTHTLLAIPFILLYLHGQEYRINPTKIIIYTTTSILTFALCNIAFWTDSSFLQMVFHNAEQAKVFLAHIPFGSGHLFYMIPCCLIFLFIKGALLPAYNKNILTMFLGFAFGIILLFVTPMPGWYYWIIPFLSFFYALEKGRSWVVFALLQATYLAFFMLPPDLGIEPIIPLENILFTTLQTVLLLNCIFMYHRGIGSYKRHKITSSPYFIGIGGNSGAGKSCISEALEGVLSKKNTTILRGDDMHKWERGAPEWLEYTHLDPKANYLHQEVASLLELKRKKRILRRHYDHDTERFTENQTILARKINIFEGLHPFYLERQRKIYDLKIFINPDEDLGAHWKIVRDIAARGHSKDKILEQMQRRKEDLLKYVQTQSNYADIVIETKLLEPLLNIGNADIEPKCYQRAVIPNSIFVENIVEALNHYDSAKLTHTYLEGDKQEIIIHGNLSSSILDQLAEKFIPGLKDIGINQPLWPSEALGITCFLIIYYIFEDSNYDR